ncbi:12-oxophytodienoate reductase 1 [Stemphylium lycopersici]|uniref:12-oxophytodienoate reductase 1 n=1 Tax=Stemphylium lycopersici TaxID=183478 RepID=A0A364NG89_STELY|nr:nadph2 dehydrogenase [Stemphylium lycopersici]RAR05094.1 12-oxophytodienoate reductase 1 [Stemphylium lycopersici]RAR16280.1 12-oxophytodienoate reductase 1 [Stemphylium lycopersici]
MSAERLFQPLKVGTMQLKNRIAMAPLTRFRVNDDHEILPMATQYYGERACVPGTLLITEATLISKQAGGYPNVPGIWTQAQIDAWKPVTKAVHDKGSYVYLQLWSLGRVANPQFAEKNGITIKSSSPVSLGEGYAVPKEMSVEEIKESINDYAQAAKNAIEAGFDGVEIHGANGYLIDQFLQDNVNKRTDSYGGSVENRSRFAVEVTQAVVDAVGAEKTGIRLSPFSVFQGMKMKDPLPQFTDIMKKLDAFNLAYLHLVEARVSGIADVEAYESLDPLLPHYTGKLLIAGGLKAEDARRLVEEHKDRDILAVFGRYFISTPDLVFRLEKGIDFTPYDRDTFYIPQSEKGYIDYPFSKEWKEVQANL